MSDSDKIKYSDEARKRYQPLRERAGQLLTQSGIPEGESFRKARKALSRELYMSGIDKVTRLPVRSLFETRLEEEFDRSERDNKPLTMAILDVNLLRIINEPGLPEGDKALRAIAGVILSSVRKTDYAARYGGDEFVVLFPGANAEDIDSWWIRFKEKMGDFPYSVTASAVTVDRNNIEKARTTLSNRVKEIKEASGHNTNAFLHLK
jgi:diguanylate cyclase